MTSPQIPAPPVPDLDAIRERLAKIDQPPWHTAYAVAGDREGWVLDACNLRVAMSDGKFLLDDAEFIAHAPADITALLQQLDSARAVIAAVTEIAEGFTDYRDEGAVVISALRRVLSGASGAVTE